MKTSIAVLLVSAFAGALASPTPEAGTSSANRSPLLGAREYMQSCGWLRKRCCCVDPV
ncbi:hypothetical protein VUR80DRAFT_9472 [Thermomyces stellatus]